MAFDTSWLSQEAQTLHAIFEGLFYQLVTLLLVLGVFVEYFKLPLGNVPSFSILVGRALIAAILLHSYSDVANLIAEFTDELAQRLGDLNQFKVVLSKLGDKLSEASASWVSIKETAVVVMSFLGYFVLYFSVYVAEGAYMFTWTLSYVFSPLLIALFVLPVTAGATRALYRGLFEIASWKIVWSALATLLWSMSLSTLNQHDVNFVAVICLNLLLASSLLATPWVVHALAGSGLSGFTSNLGAVAVGAAVVTPAKVALGAKAAALSTATRAGGVGRGIARLSGKSSPDKGAP